MNQIDLNNKFAVITGGAQGFGYSMVERFSQSGANVVIWDKEKDVIESLNLLPFLLLSNKHHLLLNNRFYHHHQEYLNFQ